MSQDLSTPALESSIVVRFASVDPNWMVRVEPTAILDALRAVRS